VSETIQERVLRVISTSRRIPLAAVQPESTLEELGIDSLDRLQILFALESEFNIEIDDEEAKKATKVRDIVEGVKQLVERSEKPLP
jgi:acyl carrier protein